MQKDRFFTLKDFYFDLPDELIAQYPLEKREESRLFALNRETGHQELSTFRQICDYLQEGDLLVLNDTKVIPARIFFYRETGGTVEIVLTSRLDDDRWLVISNRTRKLRENEILSAVNNPLIKIKVLGRNEDYIEIRTSHRFEEDLLKSIGEIPLPPYIKREITELDKERYQTVYARNSGSVAAPTAGLHFTEQLIQGLKDKGVTFIYLTLYVSWGTFKPVRNNDLKDHKMHREIFFLPEETANALNLARIEGRRVIAVGTTALRVLESTFRNDINVAGHGETDIFIYPPYLIKSIDALITNFHTPHSTLLMLVAAFAGYDRIMEAYSIAVENQFRFFSYGDAMIII